MKFKNRLSTLLVTAIPIFLFSCDQPSQEEKAGLPLDNSAVLVVPVKPADKNLLVGNWVRTDADYQLKISKVLDNGNLTTEYFNPKSINVGKAMWSNASGILNVYIELRDENYPGSNYKLNYSAEKDALAGEYFQAVESTTYKVEFNRVK